jgi:glycerol-3-phosphate acyltransferase PlsY
MPAYLIVALISYFCGSIPFGYILVRIFKGQDVRQSGSGNIGATNVARTNPLLGLATLILDGAKGYLPLHFLLLQRAADPLIALAALFVVLGHMFPIWLKFRGGKGVATAVGVFLALSPKPLGLSFLVFVLVFVATRYVSLASLLSTATFPIFALWVGKMLTTQPVFISSVVISLLIILKHHSNIRRLLNGTESRLGKKPAEALASED